MKFRILSAIAFSTVLASAAFAADAAKPGSTMPGTEHAQPAMGSTTTDTAAPSSTMGSDVVKLSTANGIVKSFDAKSRTLTLKDDQSFTLDESLKGKDLKADQHVALTFKADGQKKVVTQYTIEKEQKAPVNG